MGSISEGDVTQHCRVVCAINLQYLKEIFKGVWAFAIAIETGNNAGTAYLDLRVRCYFKKTIQNFHVLAIPMRERHTGEYQYDLVVEVMNVLAPSWRHQLAHWYNNRWRLCDDWLCTGNKHSLVK